MKDVNAEIIYGLLAERHVTPEWVIIPELRGSTGWGNSREIDAFAISCWSNPYPGYSIAYEIKVSRQDFKREIMDPTKREHFVKNSNQFFFVTPPEVCAADEVPEECGLMHVVANGKIKVMKVAKQKPEFNYAPELVSSIARNLTGKEKVYDVDKRKLFKYAGKEITREELIKIIEKENELHIKNLDDIAFNKVREEFTALADHEYAKAMKAICEALDIMRLLTKYYDRYYNEKGVYNYQDIASLIREIREKLTKEGTPDSDAKLMKIRAMLDERQGG